MPKGIHNRKRKRNTGLVDPESQNQWRQKELWPSGMRFEDAVVNDGGLFFMARPDSRSSLVGCGALMCANDSDSV